MTKLSLRALLLLALPVMALTGCATRDLGEKLDPAEVSDPLEYLNRSVYGVSEAADILFVGPASTIYKEGVPEPVQGVVRNVFRNLEMPIIAMNRVLQGRFDDAGTALGRFVVNTVAGVGGIGDVATDIGLPYEKTDFGTTLASWGAPTGPYLYLPLLGPSNLRDGIGFVADNVADPVSIVARNNDAEVPLYVLGGLSALDTRASFDGVIQDARKNSLDSYATLRSSYGQNRAAAIAKQLDRK